MKILTFAVLAMAALAGTVAQAKETISGLPEAFSDVRSFEEFGTGPEVQRYIEMLIKRENEHSVTGQGFVDSRRISSGGGNSVALPLTPHGYHERDLSEKVKAYHRTLVNYDKANGFEKRRMLNDIKAQVAAFSDYDPTIFSGLRMIDDPKHVSTAFPFDFDKMAKSIEVDNGYCDSSSNSSYRKGIGYDHRNDHTRVGVAKVYSSGNFEAFYTSDKKCYIELTFDDEALAERVEAAFNDGNLHVTNDLLFTGDALGRYLVGVGQNLVLLQKVSRRDDNGYERDGYKYLTHYAEQHDTQTVVDNTPIIDEWFVRDLIIKNPDNAKNFMAALAQESGVFEVNGIRFTHGNNVFLRYIDNETFDVVLFDKSPKLDYGAYSRYKVVTHAGGYYAVKVATVNKNWDLSDAYAMGVKDNKPVLSPLGSVGVNNRAQYSVNIKKPYDTDSWNKMVKHIAGDVALKPVKIGHRGFIPEQ